MIVCIAEKPSVAREFAKALKEDMRTFDGYQESENAVITWCVGHLVTMSYPEAYDMKFKKWSLATLPFIPETFKYEVIPGVSKQFKIVSNLLNRSDVDTIYVCTDSGREGEYIYRLVEQMAGVKGKDRRRAPADGPGAPDAPGPKGGRKQNGQRHPQRQVGKGGHHELPHHADAAEDAVSNDFGGNHHVER